MALSRDPILLANYFFMPGTPISSSDVEFTKLNHFNKGTTSFKTLSVKECFANSIEIRVKPARWSKTLAITELQRFLVGDESQPPTAVECSVNSPHNLHTA